MKKYILLIIVAIAVVVSCKKEKTVTDTTAPIITIASPTEGQTFMQMTSTDSTILSANITDEDLHAYSILIIKTYGSDTLLNVPENHQEVNDLNISKKFPLPVVTGTVSFKIILRAEDHNGNVRELVRNFNVEHM